MAVTWQCAVVNLDKKTLISGVILSGNPFTYRKRVNRFKSLRNLLLSYFWPRYSEREIIVRAGEHTYNTVTDAYGGFYLVADALIETEPRIEKTDGTELPILQSYPVIFENTAADFFVVSDIDDTIMVSHSANFFKRILTLLLKTPQHRTPVPYVRDLLQFLEKDGARVFYISKSESNLFSMLAAFIRHNDLPQGAMTLTPYLRHYQLLASKNGEFYKEKHIRFLLDHAPDQQFVLIGDDSQKDMDVYAQIAEENPDRIMKVYIRQTRATSSEQQLAKWKRLASTGVACEYIQVDDRVSDELKFFS